jgi:LmbE family N-acetylglucosaminyl deacetylase
MFADLLTEGYEPHDVKRLYIHGTDKVNTWVDITETVDLKIKALQQHVSQVDPNEVEKWMREWAEEEAKDQDMKYAEAYKVMVLKREEEKEETEEAKAST